MNRIIRIKYSGKIVRVGLLDNLFCVFENETCKFVKTVSEEAKLLILKEVRRFYEKTRSENIYHLFTDTDKMEKDTWSKCEYKFSLELVDDAVALEVRVRLYKNANGVYQFTIHIADNSKPTRYADIITEAVSLVKES